jgi:hypothetical protein
VSGTSASGSVASTEQELAVKRHASASVAMRPCPLRIHLCTMTDTLSVETLVVAGHLDIFTTI